MGLLVKFHDSDRLWCIPRYVDMAVRASDPVGQTQLISTLSVGVAATVLAANLP